ncbi:hypothetical protein PV325_009704 [Microctonus aethiopoides]|uniref:[histone H3]-lysine(36) N-trimethyltransferase n=1 Tax=Microctonus aethiopoides TaxID=144406 RepID=A0AA39FNZ9_9HYME|nr:hypothetical protein PV325_009704 [Microctonus aethiopoides]KAK0172729.1 hypothetical protein PV328_006009 [Microctonus aethiopoides]
MARRRKNDTGTTVKPPVNVVAVRKSRRQIARKQSLEDKKINGEISRTDESSQISPEELSNNQDDDLTVGKMKTVKKKLNKSRRSINRDKVVDNNIIEINEENVVVPLKKDMAESDSQEDIVENIVITENIDEGDTETVDSNQVVWQDDEDVIEETIICEEMEVDGEEMETTRYTIGDDGSVVLEEVLLMNDTNFEGKEVVQFTVIQNEDGTESMVMTSNDDENHYEESSEYIIEENVNCPRDNDENKIIVNKDCETTDEVSENNDAINVNVNEKLSINTRRKSYSLNNIKETRRSNKSSVLKADGASKEPTIKNSIPSQSFNNEENGSSIDSSISSVERRKKLRGPKEKIKKSISPCDLEKNLASITIQEPTKNPIPSEDSSNSAIDSTLININASLSCETISTSELLLSMQNDDNSTSTSDKVDQMDSDSIIMTIEPSSEHQSNTDRTPTPTADIKQKKIIDRPQNVEELSRESGLDVKTDSEDVKLSSSSENSNDTSSSLNCIKMPDFNDKNVTINQVEGEKKVGFRSRSGSTDTTGSESGSNSSGVRRSSRIRSQGLMKPRSRGRGLVTKPAAEVSKILQQEREKFQPINTPVIQALRDTPDSQSETQSDKENSNKASHSESNTSLTSGTIAGYDSDSTKPVKVKSRWRRSSELEMGGSTASRLGFGSLGVTSMGSAITPTSSSELSSNCLPTVPENVASGVQLLSTSRGNEFIKDSTINSTGNSHSDSPIPTTVGARIPLPMVTEEKDREMEERLSQFEHIQENLYLTERYTNKETKRMVCDCFLTDEEIERGELGCGEDCLNRLLMIECGSRCVVSDRCTNRRFQSCSYANCEVFRTEKKGFGLRATSDLDPGEFIMEYVGEVLDPKDFRRRTKEYSKDKNKHYYFMALKSDQIIDATMKGNISRFINHSCDPNAETQKWTVNGELRIGFFNRRFISAGEEITFDYHFQRYGKEAQRCYCESTNCRGWIGDTPEEEKEKSEKQEKRERERDRTDVKKKREVKKSYMEDEDLEDEIYKLCSGGLKNRAHTLTLSRLMVRSREIVHRTRLLQLIQSGEQPCRRLFLDYHGLRLIWSYMMDVANIDTEEAHLFRLELLKTLITLPIPNKTMLMDSKVYSVVQKWSNESFPSPKSESPVEENITDKKDKAINEEIESNCDSNDKPSIEQNQMNSEKINNENAAADNGINSIGSENIRQIIELANNLLNDWSNLKEVFRIPKKERLEQMKEHEREADSGYREDSMEDDRRETLSSTYERYRPVSDRYSRRDETGRDRNDRRRGRESPDMSDLTYRSKDKRLNDDRTNLVSVPRLTKFERRQLFALKVAKEEEERLRRQQQEMWQAHEARCLALGIDPHTTSTLDPQTGYPLFFNPTLGQWQSYPLQESNDIYLGGGQTMSGVPNQIPHQLPTNIQSEISPAMSQTGVYGMAQPGVPYPAMAHQPPPSTPQPFVDNHMQLQGNLMPVHNGSTPPIGAIGTIASQLIYVDKSVEQQFPAATPMETVEKSPEPPQQIEMPLLDLPPKWKCAKDLRGRYYYYHIKERISQWLPPPPIHICGQPDSSSSSETSEESSSSDEDVEETEIIETEEDKPIAEDTDPLGLNVLEQIKVSMRQDPRTLPGLPTPTVPIPEPKKRRDGLVQERIISPRREERGGHKKYKDIKEKQRRQKERTKMKEQMEKLRKHRRANKAKSHARHTANKLQAIAQSNELTAERKIKDTFRINMANVIVRFLNSYRQNDCKQGRITNTEDFKYLARKLTHFVMAKELKHCKSVDELQCNENVKHKAKDFVRKYMNKFGPIYQRSSDED